MNKSLKLALIIIATIFTLGIIFKFPETINLFKDGIGGVIVAISILLGIMAVFSWSVEWRDKFICLFWAVAIFSLGFGWDQGGFTKGIMFLGGYLLFASIWLFGFMPNKLAIKLIIIGAILFFLGTDLNTFVKNHPSLSILNRATSQDRLRVKYPDINPDTHIFETKQVWEITIMSSYDTKETEGATSSKNVLGRILAISEVEARKAAQPLFNKWKTDNPNQYAWYETIAWIEFPNIDPEPEDKSL